MQDTASLVGLTMEQGDRLAAAELFDSLYAELHRIAQRELARHGGGLSLGATTILHEAYLDMAARSGTRFPDRERFMTYSARVMRAFIIDHARNRHAQKRGGQFQITALDTQNEPNAPDERELTRLNEALDELAEVDATLTEIVDLKFFCGFSFAEIAAMRAVSERTVYRQWEKARIFLYRSLGADTIP
jgi:RNA polymerase sigma factor (TIGR02999 family)